MTIFARASFGIGANGTAISASNEPGIGSIVGSAPTFSNAWSHTGTQSMLVPVGAYSLVRHDFAPALGEIYWHAYIKRLTDYSGNITLATVNDQNGDTVAQLYWGNSGEFTIGNPYDGGQNSVLTVLMGGVVRLEWRINRAGNTMSLDIFTGANLDGDTPDETLSMACTAGDGTISWMTSGLDNAWDTAQFAYDDIAVADEPIGPPRGFIGLVGGDPITRTVGDMAIRDSLVDAGYAVNHIDDAAAVPLGYDGFVISESASSDSVNANYDITSTPCLVLEIDFWLGMRMVSSGTVNVGQSDAFDLVPHEITTGLPDPCVVRSVTDQHAVLEGRVASGAVVFARSGADANYVTGFAIEAGAQLTSGTAPARRVGLSYLDSWSANLSADGQALFLAALDWTLAPPASEIKVLYLARDSVSPYPGEQAQIDHLRNAGHEVVVHQAEFSVYADPYDVGVVSEEISSISLGTKYKDSTAGWVVMEPNTWVNFELTTTTEYLASAAHSSFASHYITNNTPAGTGGLVFFDQTTNVVFTDQASLGPGATSLYGIVSSPWEYLTVIAYEKDAVGTASFVVPGRRVLLGFTEASFAYINAEGWGVFDRSVEWATQGVAVPTGPAWFLWDGTSEQPLTLEGKWNGTAVEPSNFDQVT